MDGRIFDTSVPEATWVNVYNEILPPCMVAIGAEMLEASRADGMLRMRYTPGPTAKSFAWVSGGAIAEMLDQAACACGSLISGYPCPTLSMTMNILRPATTETFVAHARTEKISSVTATASVELKDADGKTVAIALVVSTLVKAKGETFAVSST